MYNLSHPRTLPPDRGKYLRLPKRGGWGGGGG